MILAIEGTGPAWPRRPLTPITINSAGIKVEAIQSLYPDCEAKRCIDSKQNRWQRVRIEFEFVSSNFRDHGHDPAACDLIVCWEHNWPECPLEVIELRSVIERLKGTAPRPAASGRETVPAGTQS